ncbi:MAG: hypothetical protein Kow00127_24480 [Bacteroidales bacterium]
MSEDIRRRIILQWLLTPGLIVLVIAIFVAGKEHEPVQPETGKKNILPEDVYIDLRKEVRQNLHDELEEYFIRLNRKGLFNGTVLYAEEGEVVFSGAFGYRDLRKKVPLQPDDAFQLASVSKMFTAMAVMILEERGLLSYDDTVTRFIPEWPYPGVTIRHLLTHRSGLSRYMSLADKYWDPNRPISNEDVIALFVKYRPAPYFKPDNGFHYCNTNYMLLASVVERITGEPFEEFVAEEIFQPCGMARSFIYRLPADSAIGHEVPVGVPGYRSTGRRARKFGDYYLNGVVGDKGIYSTVNDIFRFDKALDEEILVKRETLQQAFTPGSPKYYRRKDNYGFGWRISVDADSTVYHYGWWKGFRSFYIRDMARDRRIIALTNTHHGASGAVFREIINRNPDAEELLTLLGSINPE